MGGGNERKALRPQGQTDTPPVRRGPSLIPRATPPLANRPKRKEARTVEVDCTQIAALMNSDPARPVMVDLDADIEVVAADGRLATPTRSGRLAHTLPRFASGSGAINPMEGAGPPTVDGVPEPLEDMPTSATDRALFAPPPPRGSSIVLSLAAPTEAAAPVHVVPEESGELVAPAPPRVRTSWARVAFVAIVVGGWGAAVLLI